jgi:hypothetical protein
MKQELHGIATLSHLGVIRVQGEDAAKFLHGQLTQDFSLLGLGDARLAAFCSAKGRMLASFMGFKRSHSDILLICPRDLLTSTLKRLSMFVLRAKVTLKDESEDWTLLGIAGPELDKLSSSPRKPWEKLDLATSHVIGLYPADGIARALWVAPKALPLPTGAPMTHEIWQWSDVISGVTLISQAVSDAFVPQMLNYESVGGVNFKKGCYPGQEVVARSQFRGTLKRRGYLVHAALPLKAGDELFDKTDLSQPCGLVALAAPSPDGGYDAWVSLQVSAAESAQLQVGAQGLPVRVLALPYPLLADI